MTSYAFAGPGGRRMAAGRPYVGRAHTEPMSLVTKGHSIGFEPMICRDAGAAAAKAQRLVNGHDMELWDGERSLVRLECSPKLPK